MNAREMLKRNLVRYLTHEPKVSKRTGLIRKNFPHILALKGRVSKWTACLTLGALLLLSLSLSFETADNPTSIPSRLKLPRIYPPIVYGVSQLTSLAKSRHYQGSRCATGKRNNLFHPPSGSPEETMRRRFCLVVARWRNP